MWSNTHEEVKFQDLNDGILFDIFKYLPIKDRIRFDRISKRAAIILEDLWLGQKSIATCFGYFWPGCEKCENKHHYVSSTDILIDKMVGSPKARFYDMPVFQVLMRW
jgi:F-box domain